MSDLEATTMRKKIPMSCLWLARIVKHALVKCFIYIGPKPYFLYIPCITKWLTGAPLVLLDFLDSAQLGGGV